LLQTCWQLGTSSANTTCWRLVGRIATRCDIFTCVGNNFLAYMNYVRKIIISGKIDTSSSFVSRSVNHLYFLHRTPKETWQNSKLHAKVYLKRQNQKASFTGSPRRYLAKYEYMNDCTYINICFFVRAWYLVISLFRLYSLVRGYFFNVTYWQWKVFKT
jgi:hypothetical protein